MMKVFPGWQVLTANVAGAKRAPIGLGIRIADQGNPSPRAVAIMQALRQAGIQFDTLSGQREGSFMGQRGSDAADVELQINPRSQN
jgi:hypothetical protein